LLYSLSHSTLFKPSEIGTQVSKGFEQSKVIARWISRQEIEQKISTTQGPNILPGSICSIITDYLRADEEFNSPRFTN
jgi:hypothetical protein